MRDPLPAPLGLVQFTTPLASALSLRTLPFHTHEILPTFTLYTFLDLALIPHVSSALFPKVYNGLPERTKVNWNARGVSLVQSCFISSAALWVIFKDRERASFGAKERIWGYTGAGGMVQGLSAGYFLWDIVTAALRVDIHGFGALAHATSALSVALLGFRPFCNYYGVNLVLYELSTPFLEIHWYMDKLGMTGSTAQWVNGIILVTTFGASRLLWGTYQSVHMYKDMWQAYNTPGGLPVPPWLAIVYVAANTTLSGLNFWWFGRMITTLRARFEDNGGKKKE